MKIRILIIISAIIAFIFISFAMPNLPRVYDSCEMTQDGTLQFAIGYQWTNGLFYIDNDECTWKLFGIISMASLLSDEEFENTLSQNMYENMSCDEIAIKAYDEKISIDSKEEREIVREKLNDCDRLISSTLDYSECSSIRIIADTPLTFHITDHLLHLESKIYSCIKNNEFELNDIRLTHQTSLCNDETIDDEFFIKSCKDVQVISQPFKHSMSFEELYPEIIKNERKIIHEMDCSYIKNTYDGKMYLVGWDVHREIITDKLKECKF